MSKTHNNIEISIVIPILNEAESLPRMLDLLSKQTLKPCEIIIVDAGSIDLTIEIINNWNITHTDNQIKLIHNEGGMPGNNRNIGVKAASYEWIAFIDGGIYPEIDWLESLSKCITQRNTKSMYVNFKLCGCQCVTLRNTKSMFGICEFDANSSFEKAVCALSMGCGAKSPVLPASLFHRDIFKTIGYFDENLRSTEDILWIDKIKNLYGPCNICDNALVHYQHFPTNFRDVVKKWYSYEKNAVTSGMHIERHIFFFSLFGLIFLTILVLPKLGFFIAIIYLLIRGLLDPIRRSRDIFWWMKRPSAILIALGIGSAMDLSKTCGSFVAYVEKLIRPKPLFNNNKMSKQTEHSDIPKFFDEMSRGRNEKIQANPIVDYEQHVRALTVLNLLSPKQGEKILDVGCGNARDIACIVEQGAEVTGIDISEGMVAEARVELEKLGYNKVTLEVGDATQLHYADSEFDKVLCSEVIEHIPDADKALSEIYRVLKPNGILVLSTPNPKSWYGFDRYVIWERILRKKWPHPHDRWRSIKQLLRMTDQNGFMTVHKTGACYVPGFLVTYFVLPGFLQRLLLRFVRIVEPVFSRMLPQYAYMVCVAVIKKKTE